ncbi:Hydrophobe/amphiphile efflux-1 HAE1 [Novosphingobium aromaticivorans DSM 12444]|uniref:Efflux pump membrane transporter n=1 Tax=Novosphingobium aromaticivorans (strain ATCC 700278 / DSM 12444 / CCUG 56034 / CIP 105152 / NBRC 16084 / F199) TaxID=279238 RepID=Q2G909_NOVAD|nr:efflux RND transporter permease subunit [Novosphingobium aromaticivorans]ABD25664.1 Hydrophobe/amphiphile efflux-1 HAE1 [Novosphingobium aromaticivorans DSM 12444]SCX99964.1 multidrug efflux pump [Novosphingobium aromaticivorans]
MISRFFAHRPIFAWVLAIVIMAAGLFAVSTMGVEQYPDIAPPTVSINATYGGADASTVENSVTQVLEQQLKGLDGLLYFNSNSSNGSSQITVTFDKGTDPDTAQVQVQNAISRAVSRLPAVVQQQGVNVNKSQSDMLMVVSIYDKTGRTTNADISDYLSTHFQDPISRVEGVGNAQIFGASYAMRIWLDPLRLAAVQLMPSDVVTALQAQNTQVAAGEIGANPAPDGQRLNATVTARSRLQTPEEFENIVVKTQVDGSVVRLRDVARVEMGEESYGSISRFNGMPATGLSVSLASGANAMKTAQLVKDTVAELSKDLPAGYEVAYPRDSSTFVKLSIEEVVWSLGEAIVLVVIVMFVFLQSWRATLIPAIAVPVVLLGTFGVLSLAGYTINTLTMFGMVLAIGLLVDDAIVVVENVERVMHEEGLSPLDATVKSMDEITSALIGITLVLTAVFVPMAFFGGSTGAIYRQFSVTIVSAMTLSVLVALVFTPALCATLLKPVAEHEKPGGRFFRRFNDGYANLEGRYRTRLARVVGRPLPWMMVFAGITLGMVLLYVRLPTSFLPAEDQGNLSISYQLPVGSTSEQTRAVANQLSDYIRTSEKEDVKAVFVVMGRGQAGSAQNAGQGFILLKDWSERSGKEHSAAAIAERLNAYFRKSRDAQIFVLDPPPIRGLGSSGGFEMWLQDALGAGRDALTAARRQLTKLAGEDERLAQVRLSGLEDTPQLKVDIDDDALTAFQISPASANSTLSIAWGGLYVNDFVDRGRVKRVYVQGDAPYRNEPSDLGQWFVRSNGGQMAPFSAFASSHWTQGPVRLDRFNGVPAQQLQGSGAPGVSSGDAMKIMEDNAAKLDGNFSVAWSGLSYQERAASSQSLLLYTASIFFIFLCLAALYESWSVPVAVLLVIPLGIIGAVLAVTLRGYNNDIYFQVALLTTIGLSAKNAILIVEFAEAALARGVEPVAAALEGARLRLRPIIMTSVAFIAGVIPLAIADGAGANGRRAIGTGVMGGMLSATILAIFLVPLFFVLVKGWFRRKPATPVETVGEPA